MSSKVATGMLTSIEGFSISNYPSVVLLTLLFCRHFSSVSDWLESIDETSSDAMEGEDNFYWFHLSCPTRIAKHKDGVCEAGSFADLDNDLYVKSVKPAHSSFGVVSYDQKTDSTLLVRINFSTGTVHFIEKHCTMGK